MNARFFKGKMPTWNDFVAHPNYDAFWKRQAVAPYLTRVTVPTLNVAGWWDQEDFYGPVKIYETLEKKDTRAESVLVVGPWNHGGWAGGEGSSLGRIAFGSPTARHYREEIEAPFFACHLKDRCATRLPEVTSFETGSNEWRQYDSWPPKTSSIEEPLPAREGRAVVHRAHRGGRSGGCAGSPIPRTPCPIVRVPSSRPIPMRARRAG